MEKKQPVRKLLYMEQNIAVHGTKYCCTWNQAVRLQCVQVAQEEEKLICFILFSHLSVEMKFDFATSLTCCL